MPILKCKYFFLFLIGFFFLSEAQAQQYSIPWATQQPQWVFPIYFEEGTGQKDTIYLGYDPASSSIFYDTIFGEKKLHVDTNVFNVSICDDWFLGPGLRDSVYKSTASQMISWFDCPDAAFEFFFINGYLPLKVSWDVSLFRSDSLPFVDQDPAPRGEGYMYHNSFSQNPDMSYCAPTEAILITDTAVFGQPVDGFCIRRDSAILTDIFCPNCPVPYIQLHIRGWTGIPAMVAENTLGDDFKIYPNPVSGELKIQNAELKIERIEICDILGQRIFSQKPAAKSQQLTVDVSMFKGGIYFVKMKGEKEERVAKFVKE